MKIPRILATAVAAAVTTPVILLSVTPSFAADGPSAASRAQQQDEQGKPSIEELEKAAAQAQKAYDDAVAAQQAALTVLKAALSNDAPLYVASQKARQEATDAATAKENADKALADAQAALAALPDTATAEEKAAAEQAVTDADAAAQTAADAKAAAAAKASAAQTASDDARVAAARAYGQVQKATDAALAAKEAADKALADARSDSEPGGPDCAFESKLTTVVTGLPSKIVAGSTTDFSLRVANGSDRTLDEVVPHVYFHATDKSGLHSTDEDFHLQWATAGSSNWKNVTGISSLGAISPLKAGSHADVKLRLKVDATAPAGNGIALVAGEFVNDDKSCGGNLSTDYAFDVLAAPAGAHHADDSDNATPGKTAATSHTANTKPQGGTSSTPVDSGTPAATGSLASTGSSSALPQLAAAAGAALLLGAGAVFVARRRRADSAS